MGDPRAHHGRRDRLALGAAAAGVRAPGGPADARAGRAVLRAGQGGTRAGAARSWTSARAPGLPACRWPRTRPRSPPWTPTRTCSPCSPSARPGPGWTCGRCTAAGRTSRRRCSPADVVTCHHVVYNVPESGAVPGGADEPRPPPGGGGADHGAPADLAQPALAAVPRAAPAGRAHRGRPAGDPGRSRRDAQGTLNGAVRPRQTTRDSLNWSTSPGAGCACPPIGPARWRPRSSTWGANANGPGI